MSVAQGSENERQKLEQLFGNIFNTCLIGDKDDDTNSLIPFIGAFVDKENEKLVYFSTINTRMTRFCSQQLLLIWECLSKDESKVDFDVMKEWSKVQPSAEFVLLKSDDFEKRTSTLDALLKEVDNVMTDLDWSWVCCYEYQEDDNPHVTRKRFPDVCMTTNDVLPVVHICWCMLGVSKFTYSDAIVAMDETADECETSAELKAYLTTLEEEHQIQQLEQVSNGQMDMEIDSDSNDSYVAVVEEGSYGEEDEQGEEKGKEEEGEDEN